MTRLRILLIEDDPDDEELIVAALRRDGLDVDCRRAETPAAMAVALREPPDLVLCDYHLPGFGAVQALQVLADSGVDAPLIVISGLIGEETAVALMRAGARDFVRKNALPRLALAVRRELAEAAGRRERRRAERALRDSEARFRLLAEHAQDVIFRCELRPRFEVVYVSQAAARETGFTPEALLGDPQRVFDRIPDPQDRARLEISWRRGGAEPLVVQWRRPDGTAAWLEQRAHGVYDRGVLVAVEGALRNVTERVLAERERELLLSKLGQTERMESLGVLAGGVAHDFNNALAVILASANLVMDDLGAGHPGRADVERIARAAERSAALTRQLLLFARGEPASLEPVDVDAALRGIADLIRRTVGEDVELRLDLAGDVGRVLIGPSQLEQIVLNLVANARAAMPGGGALRMASRREQVAEGDGVDVAPGTYVCVSVEDSGTGMPPEVMKRACEPFFTTRPPGAGTGLGLSTAYGVVRQAGGQLVLQSAPGVGTSVRLYLPPTTEDAGRPADAPAAAAAGRGETVLLVEDEQPVREVLSRILTRNGFTVVTASSPREALERCRPGAPTAVVDVVLTDMVMPGLSGVQLAERLRRTRPGLPVVYMSGYTTEGLPAPGPDGPAAGLLCKPFTAAALVTRLREALDAAPDPGAAAVRRRIDATNRA